MKVTTVAERSWLPSGAAGIDKAVLWRGGHDVAVELYRLAKGADYPPHTHAIWEQMLVIEGRVALSGIELGPGDFIFTEPGEHHAVDILEDSLVLLSFGRS